MKSYGTEQQLSIATNIFASPHKLAKFAAKELAELINERTAKGLWTNLGLATGSSPVLLYRELIKLHKAGYVSFRLVRIFMLDEYYGISADNKLSFNTFIRTQLIAHLHDFDVSNFHIPRGDIPGDTVSEHCEEYERKIAAVGGIHYQLLGIGRNGHIGFNEPETALDSKTGMRVLHHMTRLDAASDFFGIKNTPTHGVSMGIGTIMKAEMIRLIACNEGKAVTIKAFLENKPDIILPASAICAHENAMVYLDEAAASELEVEKAPWSRKVEIDWTENLLDRLVMSAALEQQVPISKLSPSSISHLLPSALPQAFGNDRQEVAQIVENRIASRIRSQPGPDKGKKVIVFSPHPDDAEIQMGGTIQRLLKRGVEVVVAVMTSGRIAVWDHCAKPIVNDTSVLAQWLNISQEQARDFRIELLKETSRERRKPGENDSKELRQLKGLIRQNECINGLMTLGVKRKNIIFLELPFYETDAIEKAPPSDLDFDPVRKLIEKVRPVEVYAAGDLSDPHGTHRTCLDIIVQGRTDLIGSFEFDLLLYRGAWAEWPIDEMDVIVPLSRQELDVALKAMRKHESQIPNALFPGCDPRPFDKRAEDRKTSAAEIFRKLGYGEQFEAAEGFRYYSS